MIEQDWIDKEVARATKAAKAAAHEGHEPRARAARYDRKTGRVVIELENDCVFAFPAGNVQGLEDATPAERSKIELLGGGYGLHWPRANASLRVEGALAGIFGSRKWMLRLAASEAGSRTSPRKAAAARENGKKGGRPARQVA